MTKNYESDSGIIRRVRTLPLGFDGVSADKTSEIKVWFIEEGGARTSDFTVTMTLEEGWDTRAKFGEAANRIADALGVKWMNRDVYGRKERYSNGRMATLWGYDAIPGFRFDSRYSEEGEALIAADKLYAEFSQESRVKAWADERRAIGDIPLRTGDSDICVPENWFGMRWISTNPQWTLAMGIGRDTVFDDSKVECCGCYGRITVIERLAHGGADDADARHSIHFETSSYPGRGAEGDERFAWHIAMANEAFPDLSWTRGENATKAWALTGSRVGVIDRGGSVPKRHPASLSVYGLSREEALAAIDSLRAYVAKAGYGGEIAA